MFLKEETFCDYLQAAFPEQRFEKRAFGHINQRGATPTNYELCLYHR